MNERIINPMKKIPIYAMLILILLLLISVWKNYSYAAEKRQLRNEMLSRSFHAAIDISGDLEVLLTELDSETLNYEEAEEKLIQISHDFIGLHCSLRTFAAYFPPTGVHRNSYTGMYDFEFVAKTLTAVQGELNGKKYWGIMYDNAISDKEIEYLKILKKEIDRMIDSLSSNTDKLNMIDNISTSCVDDAINHFVDKLDIFNGESPLYLLFE